MRSVKSLSPLCGKVCVRDADLSLIYRARYVDYGKIISVTSPLTINPLPEVSVSKKIVRPDVNWEKRVERFAGFGSGAERLKVLELQSAQVTVAVFSAVRVVCREIFSGVGLSIAR